MTRSTAPRLADDLPFRRIALVLSGGGALGAYEVGVLRVLEAAKLVPSVVLGVSIGAINAIAWVAAGHDATALERVWRTARGETLGVQWVSLALRVTGALTALIASIELVLTALGSREFSGAYWVWKSGSSSADLLSTQLDLALWVVLGLVGVLLVLFARRVARDLEGRANGPDPTRLRLQLRNALIAAASLHTLVWLMGWPWPHRFSASVVLLLSLAWLGSSHAGVGSWLRNLALGLMPETGGRGLWSGRARRRILERLVAGGDPRRLTGPHTRIVVTALCIGNGRLVHFVSWPEPDPAFVARLEGEQGEVVPVKDAAELIQAAVASSAIPGLFQPEPVAGRDCVDPGGFSNQPLHVAIAESADAVIVVLLSPSDAPSAAPPSENLVGLGGRLLELMNWRDLQTELRHLPEGWSREGRPARVCVVEPTAALPAALLVFDPQRAGELIETGSRDARAALERAGWLARS